MDFSALHAGVLSLFAEQLATDWAEMPRDLPRCEILDVFVDVLPDYLITASKGT